MVSILTLAPWIFRFNWPLKSEWQQVTLGLQDYCCRWCGCFLIIISSGPFLNIICWSTCTRMSKCGRWFGQIFPKDIFVVHYVIIIISRIMGVYHSKCLHSSTVRSMCYKWSWPFHLYMLLPVGVTRKWNSKKDNFTTLIQIHRRTIKNQKIFWELVRFSFLLSRVGSNLVFFFFFFCNM